METNARRRLSGSRAAKGNWLSETKKYKKTARSSATNGGFLSFNFHSAPPARRVCGRWEDGVAPVVVLGCGEVRGPGLLPGSSGSDEPHPPSPLRRCPVQFYA